MLVKTRTGHADPTQQRLHLGHALEQGERSLEGHSGVGRLDGPLEGDVRADAGRHHVPGIDHRLHEPDGVLVGRHEQRVHQAECGDLGVVLGQPHAEAAAHRQADHDHGVGAGRQLDVGLLGRACDQSFQRVSSMSSTAVPWPGSNGSSTVKPASARATARPRMDCGLPVKPCNTSAPRLSPDAE